MRLGYDALMGLERPIGLGPRWEPGQPTQATKVGPIKAHLRGRPQGYISKGTGAPHPNPSPLWWLPPSLPCIKP